MAVEILRQVPFFAHMADSELEAVYKLGQVIFLQAGEVVVHEGDVADSLYVILNGEVRVHKNDAAGGTVDIAKLGAADFFGEMALLDEGARSASVSCISPCHFFTLNQSAFLALLAESDSQAILRLFAALTKRVRDTSERFFHEELNKQRLEADMQIERHRALAQMVAGVAHEINTPLGIINTAADLIGNRLRSGQLRAMAPDERRTQAVLDDIQEASELIQNNIKRAHKLVQDFKKISINQVTDSKEAVMLPELVASSVDLFKINARKAKLNIQIDDGLPTDRRIWQGYPASMTQVLLNLLTNVERYAYDSESGGDIHIRLSASDKQHLCLTVQDFGRGIAAEHLPQIFDPFFTTGRSKGGTGLGMAIVYNLVTEMFGGKIDIDSQPGAGACVSITFPIDAPERPANRT